MDERAPLSPLLPWRTRPFPVDWAVEFGRSCPVHLEIGFGDGRFTVRRAHDEPGACFVGLEISSASVQRALRRVKREGVDNVRLAKAGAQFALRHLFAEHALAGIVVNFPDPWPKERHVERRLLQRSFYRLAASRLQPGGAVRLATDHPEYLAFAIAEARAAGGFEVHETAPPPAVFETKYALKWKAQGKALRYVEFRYDGSPTESFPPLERPSSMPHALLTGSLPPAAPFAKVVLPYGEGHVILHEVARSFGPRSEREAHDAHTPGEAAHAREPGADEALRPRWWARASVDEPDIRQHLLVLVQQRSDDEVIVRLEPFGDPVITPTVRGAVHAVTEWLLAATDLTLKARNY
ncbi:MAG: tRNA (guanosine(46)-N7)-methyltransferase TrmB [Deinococcales bacterium]